MQWSPLARGRRQAIAVGADVSDDAACRTLVEAAMDKWGRLDILVNNAGTTKFMDHANLAAWIKPTLRRFMPSTPLHPTKWCARPPHLKIAGPAVW